MKDVKIDLMLPRGKTKVLKADEKDYERGMLVKLLDDGGYKFAYWYKHPSEIAPAEILVDGVPIKKDAKVVEMKFHPKSYYKRRDMLDKMKPHPDMLGKKKTQGDGVND